MNYFLFDEEITPKSVKGLISEIETTRPLPDIKKVGDNDIEISVVKLTIYITTNGGWVGTAYVLSDYLKRLVDEQFCEIDIFISEFCNSSGIFLLHDLSEFSKKHTRDRPIKFYITEHSEYILHEVATEVNTRQNDTLLTQNIEKIKKRREKLIKAFKPYLTKEEIKTLNKSEDVLLDSERMAKILNANIVKTF